MAYRFLLNQSVFEEHHIRSDAIFAVVQQDYHSIVIAALALIEFVVFEIIEYLYK